MTNTEVTPAMQVIAAKIWSNETAIRKVRRASFDKNGRGDPSPETTYALIRLERREMKLYAELVACNPESFSIYESERLSNLTSWHRRELGL